ncbi:MAG TPA: F0F1 ATP synthase subunit delta [Pirellulales bacterium]|nr:F0F1 ATP synthase subunit delta [Pirellulales bacterium]
MNVQFWTFLFEMFNFVVVAFVLHRVLYRPLHEAIDRRRQATEQAQAEAGQAQRDAAALQARLESERREAESRREELVREAHRQAEAEAQRLLDDARRHAREQAEDLRRQLAHERDQGLSAARQQLVGLAVDLADRFLRQSADRSLHSQLVSRLVTELEVESSTERRKVRMAWTEDEPAVIETAEELDQQNVDRIAAAVANVVGQQVTIQIKSKPALISGVCLQLGGHLWDASLRGPLQNILAEDQREAVHV